MWEREIRDVRINYGMGGRKRSGKGERSEIDKWEVLEKVTRETKIKEGTP